MRWFDGTLNFSDVLTKDGAPLDYFKRFLKSNEISLVQDAAAKEIKDAKKSSRERTREKQKLDKEPARAERRRRAAQAVRSEDLEALDKDDMNELD